jgi:hypothetical protein
MRRSRVLVPLSVALVALIALVAAPTAAGAGGGGGHGGGGRFEGPVFGIDTARNGDILVADASAGVFAIRDRHDRDLLAEIPGATDVSPIGQRSLWVSTGAGEDPEADTGQGLYRVSNGHARKVVNLFEFEATENPDGNDPPDSNPFDVQSLGPREALVVDAGGNDLLRVDRRGNVHVLAVFPDELVSTANIKELAGCPDGPPDFCELPDEIPAQAVPTSVAIGPDGNYYVGELKGFPAPTGESRIWRVDPDASSAQCGSSPDCELVFDGGFTSIIDLRFDKHGSLFVAELDEASWAAVEIFQQPTGGTINSCDVEDQECSEVASGIPVLTSITFGKDRTLWATRNALTPGQVEVFEVD